jgi:hypothetical protein
LRNDESGAGFLSVLFVWSPMLSAEDVTITLRLVNGRNGKPITEENLNVFLNGSGFAENY